MRKLSILIVAFGIAMMATNAQAAEITGIVRSINTKSDAITLRDGKVYVLPEGIEAESVKVGEKVKITFTKQKGRNRVSALHVIK